MKIFKLFASLALAAVLGGCAEYRWTSRVPEELRTMAVPVFENRSKAAELGTITSQYVLRELQREGTFAIRRSGDSSLEIQGAIVSADQGSIRYDRAFGMRASEYSYRVTAEVSLVNKETGKILFENRRYRADTTFLVQGDIVTGRRNASQRIAQELAQQIVDDVVSFPYNRVH